MAVADYAFEVSEQSRGVDRRLGVGGQSSLQLVDIVLETLLLLRKGVELVRQLTAARKCLRLKLRAVLFLCKAGPAFPGLEVRLP